MAAVARDAHLNHHKIEGLGAIPIVAISTGKSDKIGALYQRGRHEILVGEFRYLDAMVKTGACHPRDITFAWRPKCK